MPGFWAFVRAQRKHLPLVPTPSTVSGGTYIVTGGNTGLGHECAKHLVELGAARVIIGVRSIAKGEAAIAAIQEATGRQDVGEVWELDLASFESIETFAKRIHTLDRVDALIENASVALAKFTLTEGMETSAMVNVVGTMLLAIRALPKLQQSAKKFNIKPHLVVVASGAAFDLKGVVEGLKGDVFEAMGKPEAFNMSVQYPLTKLLQIYAVRQLAALYPESETGVVINELSPGLCVTELTRNAPLIPALAIGSLRLLVGRTAEQGSRTLLHAAVAGPESHGKYLSDCEIKENAVPKWVTDENGSKTQKRVWADLVKALRSRGQGVDVPAESAK